MEDIEPEKIQSEAMAEGETAVNEEVNASKEHIDSVKVVTQLDDIYIDTNGSLKNVHEKRYLNCSSRFEQLYEEKPQFFVRAPGRANIIGEHIDYCGYSVLPFALEQDFIIAYSKSTRKEIRINNIDMALFPEEILETEPRQKMRETACWINYFLAGYKSVMCSPEIEEEIKNGFEPTGLKVFIDSNVPMEAGVSSSSAFTVCTAILSLHANGFLDKFDRTKLANYIINGERLVGTASGGMDQTISLMAEKGEAKFIDFHPKISAQSTSIPSKYVFVVSNSLTPSPKAIQFATRYNKRVVECRIATIILAKAHDKSGTILDPESCPYKTLYELQCANNWDNDTLLELISSTLKPGGYSKSDVEEALNSKSVEISLNDIQKMYEVWQNNVRFFIYERAYHVISEYKRVLQFRSICMNDTIALDEKGSILGELMNQSHESLRTLYDCSSDELEELTTLCRDSGALGSRLTGAGWGGCCISLIREEDTLNFIDKVYDYYTKEREPGKQLWVTDDLERYVFCSKPSSGACVLDPKYCIWF